MYCLKIPNTLLKLCFSCCGTFPIILKQLLTVDVLNQSIVSYSQACIFFILNHLQIENLSE